MSDFITIQVSAKTYSGFRHLISKDVIRNMSEKDIIDGVKNEMKRFFSSPHDLYLLKSGIDDLQLHLHDQMPFENDIIYLCDHCH